MDESRGNHDPQAYHRDSLEECLRLMEQNGLYHLLVLDERQVYRGMLSVSDMLKIIASDEKARADLLESFIYPQR
jgi:Mg/Co/Ni transporter MgtE